jgi:membrane associated rhomboid family serine protease
MDSKTLLGVALLGVAAYFAGAMVSLAGSAGPLVLASQAIGGLAAGVLAFFLLMESADSDPSEVPKTWGDTE